MTYTGRLCYSHVCAVCLICAGGRYVGCMDLAEQLIDFADERRNSGLAGPELLPVRLMRACAKVLPVAAAGISIFSRGDHRVPLGASDDTAAFAERLQFTVGEGPCLNAHNRGRPILATEAVISERWPTFYDELVTHTPYRSITSFPVRRGLNGDAAIDLYFTDPQPQVSPRCLADAWCAVDTVGGQLTQGWKPTAYNVDLPAWPGTSRSRPAHPLHVLPPAPTRPIDSNMCAMVVRWWSRLGWRGLRRARVVTPTVRVMWSSVGSLADARVRLSPPGTAPTGA